MIHQLKLNKNNTDFLLFAESDDCSVVNHIEEAAQYYKDKGYTCIESACRAYALSTGLSFGSKTTTSGQVIIEMGNCY